MQMGDDHLSRIFWGFGEKNNNIRILVILFGFHRSDFLRIYRSVSVCVYVNMCIT